MNRKLLSLVVCVICSASALFASENRTKRNDSDGANAAADKKTTIVFVGIESRSLPPLDRDYFEMDEAEIETSLNRIMFDAFSEAMAKKKCTLIACSDEQAEIIGSGLDFVDADSQYYERTSDISACDEDRFREMLAESEAQYLLVIDQYDVRKEGYPYNNFAHILRYSVYDRNKNKVFNGRHQFAMLDAVEANTLAKQSQKAAGKFLSIL